MRGIAARLDVSATALYQHFESKASILREIRMYGIDLLQAALEPATVLETSTLRLSQLQRSYIAFAQANPWLYTVLMTQEQLDWADMSEEEVARSLRPLRLVRSLIAEGAACGEFRSDIDVERSSFQMWAALHGLCSLLIAGRIAEEHPAFPVTDRAGLIESFVENLLRSTCLS